MSPDLHPSQLHQQLQLYSRANQSSLAGLGLSLCLLFLGTTQKPHLKPWVIGSSVATLELGRRNRQTAKSLKESLSDIEQASRLNYQALVRSQTQLTSQLAITVGEINSSWQPNNLITDPVAYIQQKQKHVALVGGTGDGKSTFTQYLSSKIGGRVIVYDSDAKPDDWAWLDQTDVIGRKGNFKAIDTAMGQDLAVLKELVELRGDGGDTAIAGRERFLIGDKVRSLAYGIDISLAAKQMGHSLQVHSNLYHSWINDQAHHRAFEAALMKSDRPLPPTL